MHDHSDLYIGGRWVPAATSERSEVIDPSTEEPCGSVPVGGADDVERAVAAARAALPAWSVAEPAERAAVLRAFADELEARAEPMAQLLRAEAGAAIALARRWQVGVPIEVLRAYADLIEQLPREERVGNSVVVREAAGVAVAIPPWNFPLLLGVNKVAAAMAAGCPVILKPSGTTPLHAFLLAEAADAAGVPAGVFNLVSGPGRVVGEGLVRHPGVDVVSLTGSTGSGRRVGALAAEGVKRAVLELGGKSANLILDDADLEQAVRAGVDHCFTHVGQVCFAWTRMVVPRERHDEAAEIAAAWLGQKRIGDPADEATEIGPVVSAEQRETVRGFIAKGRAEGARLVCGGEQPPEGFERGYYVRPTIFADVDNAMTIAQEEIFGPVLSIIPHDGDDDAVRIANDSRYGLHGAVFSADVERATRIARRMKTGLVDINGGPLNHFAPFGGVKESGVGRDHGRWGLAEYEETKSLQYPIEERA